MITEMAVLSDRTVVITDAMATDRVVKERADIEGATAARAAVARAGAVATVGIIIAVVGQSFKINKFWL